MQPKLHLILTVVTLTILLVMYFVLTSNSWTLSVYNKGATTLRLQYDTLEACMDAGNQYVAAGTAERIDCGFKCENPERLDAANVCKKVCDQDGCRL